MTDRRAAALTSNHPAGDGGGWGSTNISGADMNDLHVSATIGAAVLLWTIGGALALLELFTSIHSGAAGVTIATGAAVLNVRAYFCRFADRAQNAFDLGRDYESTRVHSVR